MIEFVMVLLSTAVMASFGTTYTVALSITTTRATSAPVNNRFAERVELAIQDLYAEFNTMCKATSVSGVEGAVVEDPAIHMDDALSAKAKYVADNLWYLANCGTSNVSSKKTESGTLSAGHVDTAPADETEADRSDGGGSHSVAKVDDEVESIDKVKAKKTCRGSLAEAVEQVFHDTLHKLERLSIKSPCLSSTIAAVPKQRPLDTYVPLFPAPCHATGGRFKKFRQFKRHHFWPTS